MTNTNNVTSKIQSLTTQQLYRLGTFDSANRWYPCEWIAEYFKSIRPPSRAYPFSYWRAAKTKKFMRWLIANNLTHIII